MMRSERALRKAGCTFGGASIAAAISLSIGVPAASQAEPSRSSPPGKLGINRPQQVALRTADLARAIVFYRDVLGLTFMFETRDMAFFDVGGMRLMLGLDPGRKGLKPTSIIYFDAPEFDAAVTRLTAAGVKFDGPIEVVQRSAAGELKLREFSDPDGNALAVMGLVPRR